MKPRRVIDSDLTPSGDRIELIFEAGHYIVRVGGASLMSSAMVGSEVAMAKVAAARLGDRSHSRVLVGGLGLGFTLRAALEAFSPTAQFTVAELLPAVVRFNRGELGALTENPLDDSRVTLFEGDVRRPLTANTWDAVLLDVDNGPEAFTDPGNADLYGENGIRRLGRSLAPGGIAVIWSAFPSPPFVKAVNRCGLKIESLSVRARESGKGPRHTLFVIEGSPSRHRP